MPVISLAVFSLLSPAYAPALKILHITHGYPPESAGGTEFYLRSLAAAQRDAGHHVIVLSGTKEQRPTVQLDHAEQDGIEVIRIHRDDLYFDHYAKLYHPEVEQLVRRILTEQRPDRVHIHQWIRLTSNLVEIASQLDIPTLVTLHDVYSTCPRCFRVDRDEKHCERPLSVASCIDCVPRFGYESDQELAESIGLFQEQFSSELTRAGQVLVAGQATAEIVVANTGLELQDIEFVAIPYQPRLSAGPQQANFPGEGEPFRFAFWGSASRRKGCEHLMEAFAQLHAAGLPRPAELHIFGSMESEDFAVKLASLAAGLPVQIHGHYELDDLAAVGLHMAVFPALGFETYGLVLDEARELGIPCILSDLGAMPIRAGAGALRVPPGDAAALSGAMRDILELPDTWLKLRSNLPMASPTPAEHVAVLEKIYGAVGRRAEPANQGQLAARRADFLLLRRESERRGSCPEGGPR